MKRLTSSWAAVLGSALLFVPAALAQGDRPAEGPKPEELFSQLDKNGDGKLSADEIADDRKRFFERLVRVADKNEDGALSKEEFVKGLQPEGRRTPLPEGGFGDGGRGPGNPGEFFKRLDANGDGKVTKDELPEPLRDRLQPLFERLGKDELTQEEFARLANRGGFAGANRPAPEEMFKRLDRNGDGKVTKDELPDEARDRLAPLFERLGKDEITKDDLARFAPPREGQRDPGARAGDGRPGEGRPGEGRPGERRPGDGPPPVGPGRLPPFFRILDTDGDGRLSKEELAKLSDKFGELDRNRDGQLDPSELFGPPPEGGRRPEGDRPPPEGGRRPEGDRPPRAEGDAPRGRGNGPLGGEIFKRLDRNGDGKLVADELPPRVRVNFEKADANGDGALDENEFRQATADAFRREGRGAQPSP